MSGSFAFGAGRFSYFVGGDAIFFNIIFGACSLVFTSRNCLPRAPLSGRLINCNLGDGHQLQLRPLIYNEGFAGLGGFPGSRERLNSEVPPINIGRSQFKRQRNLRAIGF